MTALPASPWTLDSVPGSFTETDMRVFEWLLSYQARRHTPGDLLEIGVHLGRSAIVLGRHLREGDVFTVCDLFGSPAPGEDNRREVTELSPAPDRDAFEINYLAYHSTLPEVVHGPSASVAFHVKPGSCRFVHLDASHLHAEISADLAAARELLVEGGVVAVDGYRCRRTPGVAAAVWEAFSAGGLRPVCLSPGKFYGTWGDPGPIQDELVAWLAERPDEWTVAEETVAGRRVIRLDRDPADAAAPGQTLPLPEVAPEAAQEAAPDSPQEGTPAPAPVKAPAWTSTRSAKSRRAKGKAGRGKRKKSWRHRLARKLVPNALRRLRRR
ncbi:hypothetical protein Misp01_06710 [Microtetraspora sp. NBRC 13810]|uniref:class I SAM-dependent methyltransferase n=1 Tax=Microtetraspora sp. NBRC 13810 TaxID=3030990 RepID=UPI0024A4167C|nr:class I SAM-dependent methyltransferase [Microtetraspora sp. NBRC 13810]GLW05541.1 hypothetical protein Misp01_06710 [Microtetraspora sp. NBRC 13810]